MRSEFNGGNVSICRSPKCFLTLSVAPMGCCHTNTGVYFVVIRLCHMLHVELSSAQTVFILLCEIQVMSHANKTGRLLLCTRNHVEL